MATKKRKLLIIVIFTLLGLIATASYFVFWKNAKSEFSRAINKGDWGVAEKIISEGKFDSDSTAKFYAIAVLNFKKPNGNFVDGFNHFFKAVHNNSTIHFSLSNDEIKSTVINYLTSANQSQKFLFTSNLELKNAPQEWKDFFWNFFHSEAVSKQSVDAWSNCFRVANTIEQSDMALHARRGLFLDFESFHSLGLNKNEILKTNPCYTPILENIDRIHNKHYTYYDLFNNSFDKNNFLAWRYIVADFNTTDENGNCKGCNDEQAKNNSLEEFKELLIYWEEQKITATNEQIITSWYNSLSLTEKQKWGSQFYTYLNYFQHVDQFRTEPLYRDPIIEIEGKKYCIGQRMCLCEIQNDTLIMVAQFVTSSKNAAKSQSNQHDFDGQPRYYGPKCKITSRYWDHQFAYDSLDQKRDKLLGFGSQHVITYKGHVPLPNFMHITPDDEFPGAKGYVNGIHEFAVGGKRPGVFMGTPISLGCVRLHDYPSKFVRWWTPKNANFFTCYENSRYVQIVPK